MAKGKQRGSGWSIRLALFLYGLFGYKFIYYLQYPIAFFYFLVAKNAKEPLKIYYKNLGVEFNNKIYYEHLRIFAVCLLDRFISKINPENYTIEYDNVEIPRKVLGSGSLLVFSHFGGWASSLNTPCVTNKVNIVMQEVMVEGIQEIEKNMKSKSKINIIDLNHGSISVSIQIANALMNEEIVAMMADRITNEKSVIEVSFLGKKARFNKNPFTIAYKTDKPIAVFFVILEGMQKYKIEYIIIHLDREKSEEEAIGEACIQYVEKYEEVVRNNPQQWFNLFDFWDNK